MKHYVFSELIIFENDNYIAINKPPFISTLDERVHAQNIKSMAKSYCSLAQLCHRLDKETSGVLVIAKHNDAYKNLAKQFENRTVYKEYHAVAEGVHQFTDVNVYLPVHALPNGTVKIDTVNGKIAETFFNTLQTFRYHTLVKCNPITGRMHQIRVHMACLKAPIVGDTQYGGKLLYLSQLKKNYNLKKNTEELPVIQRVALHARTISFSDMDEKPLIIEAPYPKDFAVLLKQLEKYN
ncbi:MAG: RluA family pseudouridine synthase [Cytophagaceae bacterium]|nr:RluA family pseudouridine synthase [Cytophagaceae bacterium]MDW8456532.1 RluA family pseudouridine synthase [Cytophagaceae bacterium]